MGRHMKDFQITESFFMKFFRAKGKNKRKHCKKDGFRAWFTHFLMPTGRLLQSFFQIGIDFMKLAHDNNRPVISGLPMDGIMKGEG
jgi:hypothetical protein